MALAQRRGSLLSQGQALPLRQTEALLNVAPWASYLPHPNPSLAFCPPKRGIPEKPAQERWT